jgi:hypothetical protein
MKGDVLRREADQHDRNASVILSGVAPSRDDLQCATRETEHANDKRALADGLDSAAVASAMYGVRDTAKQIGVTEELLTIWLESGQVKATVEMNKLFDFGRFLFDEDAIASAMLLAKAVKSV